MSKNAWSATAVSSIIVPALPNRARVFVQLFAGEPVCLGLGEDAVFGEGMKLGNALDWANITGPNAEKAIHAICDAGNSATGGSQT